eukprot:6340489-Prymnesium_polylepis.1
MHLFQNKISTRVDHISEPDGLVCGNAAVHQAAHAVATREHDRRQLVTQAKQDVERELGQIVEHVDKRLH